MLIDVGLIAKDSDLVKKMKQATDWKEQVMRDGKSHQHGPPHTRAWAAPLLALTDEDLGAARQFAVRGSLEALRGTVCGALAPCKVDMKPGRAPATAVERKQQERLEEWQL